MCKPCLHPACVPGTNDAFLISCLCLLSSLLFWYVGHIWWCSWLTSDSSSGVIPDRTWGTICSASSIKQTPATLYHISGLLDFFNFLEFSRCFLEMCFCLVGPCLGPCTTLMGPGTGHVMGIFWGFAADFPGEAFVPGWKKNPNPQISGGGLGCQWKNRSSRTAPNPTHGPTTASEHCRSDLDNILICIYFYIFVFIHFE